MGAASCKSLKSSAQNQQNEDNKNIVIGVFGLDDAGKTSIVKAIQGDPTDNVSPTTSSKSVLITYPLDDTTNRIDKNKTKQRIQIIDLSGERRFREQSWSQFYDQIHGLIYVFDTSERNRFRENQETLADLLEHDQLHNKPILIFANKQDQRGAINNEYELKRKLNIERLKTKYKLELSTALPQDDENNVDESIPHGFTWLIQTITDNYIELNSRINKTKNTQKDKQLNRSGSNGNTKITSEKLPDINLNKSKTKAYSDDENDDQYNNRSSSNGFLKKKKVLGNSNTNQSLKKSHDTELKAFRSTYESFPEETPWSISTSLLKSTKSDDLLSRLTTRTSLTTDTKRRDVSPLVRDTKSYTNGSSFKRDNYSDDEGRSYNHTIPTNRFSSATGKPSTSLYNDDENNYNSRNHLTTLTTKKSYDNNDYYSSSAKPTTRFSNKNDYSTSNSQNRSRYNDDDDNYHPYSSTKPTATSKYNDYKDNDDDDDDKNCYSSSKTATTQSKYNNGNRSFSSSKPTTHSKFDDDDDNDDEYYPSSSVKATGRSKYDDEDDDKDYPNSSRKGNYSSSYNNNNGSNGYRSHFGNDSFFTANNGSNTPNRSRKSTYEDD